MLLLAFDTATPNVTVALHDGEAVVAGYDAVDARRQAELLAPGIAAVLAQARVRARDLTDVVVGVGPGPFTGLRVGVVTARAMAAALEIPVRGVCTLDALAADAGGGPLVAVTDARRKEVYWARYAADLSRVEGPAVDRPDDLAGRLAPGSVFVGRGALQYAAVLSPRRGPLDPSAAALARAYVDGAVEVLPAEPLYLRRPDARAPDDRKRVG